MARNPLPRSNFGTASLVERRNEIPPVVLGEGDGAEGALEAEAGSSAMDVYLDYGDSRRIIECASGMEKMMASLAIRVALINVSSLTKTNMINNILIANSNIIIKTTSY